jgi:hypothetical protein
MPAITPEEIARLFHETYERLAPEHGYHTRPASAVPWEKVPGGNRSLMVATVAEILPAIERSLRDLIADEIDDIDRDGFGSERDGGLDVAAATVRGET